MSKRTLLLTVLAVAATISAAVPFACAAPGDFLFEWGGRETFNTPHGITIDAEGNVYVVDTYNQRIQIFDSKGNFIRAWGSWGIGDGQFRNPLDIALDSTGNVYVSDFGNSRVQVFDKEGAYIREIGIPYSPQGLAVDARDNLYIVVWFPAGISELLIFDSTGNHIDTWGGFGYEDGNFIWPSSVAVGPNGNVYVTDTYTNLLHVFDSAGNFITRTQSPFYFRGPRGLATDSSGRIYVAAIETSTIHVFDSNANFITAWGMWPNFGMFAYPRDVAVHPNGNIYVADGGHHKIQVLEGFRPKVPHTIEEAAAAVEALLAAGDISNAGTATSLTATLSSSLQAQENGNVYAARNTLLAFINKVQAQAGKNISEEAAALLIEAANNMLAALQ